MEHSSRTQVPTNINYPNFRQLENLNITFPIDPSDTQRKKLTSLFPPRVRLHPSPIEFYLCHQTRPIIVLARPNRVSHHKAPTKVPCHQQRPPTYAAWIL